MCLRIRGISAANMNEQIKHLRYAKMFGLRT